MHNDKTTLRDLSIFPADGSGGVFALVNRAVTQAGAAALRHHIQHPPDTFERLAGLQQVLRFWHQHPTLWPAAVSNGTLVMLEKFFESADNTTPPPRGLTGVVALLFQKTFHKSDYFFTKFSVSHLSDFLRGCTQLVAIIQEHEPPPLLLAELEVLRKELDVPLTAELLNITPDSSYSQLLRLQYRARRELKKKIYLLMDSFARLDAWRAMALATLEHGWTFPVLLPEQPVTLHGAGFYHPLLGSPVAYDANFVNGRNFMILTGANMSGKTTYLRALGVCALLAHLGMGVPAQAFSISFLHGIITNMHTEDNILKGESYFLAEVLRMKQIASRLGHSGSQLLLMDELFKGTNVHDACECTRAVVEGLMQYDNHVMALSTHLYEVAQQFADNKNIQFAYFVTEMEGQARYRFTYRLQPGISNDRIGYLILQQEGVLDLLQQKPKDNEKN